MEKRFQIFLLLLSVFAFVIVGVIYWSKDKSMQAVQNQTPSLLQSTMPHSDPTADWETFTDSLQGFSLRYPPGLTPQIVRDQKLHNDTFSFQTSPTTGFFISLTTPNIRWPDLSTYLNDQFLTCKGPCDNKTPKRTLPSGIQLWDVGTAPLLGHQFVGELATKQFITFHFYNESIIDGVLSSLQNKQ